MHNNNLGVLALMTFMLILLGFAYSYSGEKETQDREQNDSITGVYNILGQKTTLEAQGVIIIKTKNGKAMRLEKGIPEELVKKGYWLKTSEQNYYLVQLDAGELNVQATAYPVDLNYIDYDCSEVKNGEKVELYASVEEDNWLIKIDVWPKCYYPIFNPERHQWYHKHDFDGEDFIANFNEVLQRTYDIAMKESGIEIY